MEKENKGNIEKVIESVMQKISEANANQIVGTPIKNESGQMVIPVSNLTVVSFGGGGEYGDVKISKSIGNHFAGGTFTVCNLKPNTFLIDNGSGFFVMKNNDSFDAVFAIIKNMVEKFK